MAYELDPDEGVRESIARCAREQLDRAVADLTEAIRKDPVGAVHSARKAVKKERSLLRLTRGSMPAKQRRRENTALRTAARGLSDARDAEAITQTLEQLADRFAGQLPESTFAAVRQRLELTRNTQRDQLVGSAFDARAVQELSAVRLRVDDWKLAHGGWKAIDAGLLRSYQRGRKAFARVQSQRSMEDLHAWRKRVKDLWYHEHLLAAICGSTIRGQAKDAHRLADLLGDDHDLGMLHDALTRDWLDVPVDLDALVSLIDYRRDELQTEAIYIGERVYAEKPNAFRRRVRRYWTAGWAIANTPRERHPAELADTTREVHAA